MGMKNKIAFVTGGTRGIGAAISQKLAKECKVVIAGYKENKESAIEWLKTLSAKHNISNISLFQANISSPEASQLIEERLLKKYGVIDVLVNNAGITRNGLFDAMLYSSWRDVVETNLDSLYIVTNPIIKSMKKNRFGRIINISSVNGQKGQCCEVNYSVTKAGIIGFTKALAQEVAEYNITVNTVSPGYIDTELTKTLNEKLIHSIIQSVPVKRLGTPYEVARMVAFLADDDSGFITGANFSVNGGLLMS
jgi:acetoacetyl-CoA reductase